MVTTENIDTFINPTDKRYKKLNVYVVSKTIIAAAQPKDKLTSKPNH